MILRNFINCRHLLCTRKIYCGLKFHFSQIDRGEICIEVSFTSPEVLWMLIMKLPYTKVKLYPELKSHTGAGLLQVSCKRTHSYQQKRIIINVSAKSKLVISVNIFKVGLSSSKDNYFICFNESPLKITKNTFYFTLKARFVLQILEFLCWFFGHVEKTARLER